MIKILSLSSEKIKNWFPSKLPLSLKILELLYSIQELKNNYYCYFQLSIFYVIINEKIYILKQMKKQIICIGGGGFGRNPKQRIVEKYILQQSNVRKLRICYLYQQQAPRISRI